MSSLVEELIFVLIAILLEFEIKFNAYVILGAPEYNFGVYEAGSGVVLLSLLSMLLSCLGKVNLGPTCLAVLLIACVEISRLYCPGPG